VVLSFAVVVTAMESVWPPQIGGCMRQRTWRLEGNLEGTSPTCQGYHTASPPTGKQSPGWPHCDRRDGQ